MNDAFVYDSSKRVFGKKRYFKEIAKKEFHFLFDSSPLELDSATEYYDIESFEYFLVINFSRVVSRRIRSFKTRIFLYLDSPVPYKKISHTYEIHKKKLSSTLLGGDDYIPIPQEYFKRYEIFIDEVEWEDGEILTLSCSTVGRKSDSDRSRVSEIDFDETPSETREKYPAVVMPKISDNAWICCCSQKNKTGDEVCSRCGRTLESLESMIAKSESGEVSRDSYSHYQRSRKVEHIKARTNAPNSEKKERQIEEEMEKVEKRERYKDKMKIQAIPRLLLYFAAGYLIYLLLRWVESL